MPEEDQDNTGKRKDRKLGDQWTDWDGRRDSTEAEINENRTTFFLLSIGIVLILIALVPLAWYLIKPRIFLLNPLAAKVIEDIIIGLASVCLLLFLMEGVSLLTLRRSLFPYRLREKFILFLLPKTVWLGSKFGISRDRVGNSFIKVHNFIIKNYSGKLNSERLLILLPRCLKRETRNQIIDKVNGDGFKILTAGGGEAAREAIKEYRPTFILALACERDLMSGIKDVAENIPVLAIPNKRPEGPCKNTDVYLEELDEALKFITERKSRETAKV
jgi:hypothetical protein